RRELSRGQPAVAWGAVERYASFPRTGVLTHPFDENSLSPVTYLRHRPATLGSRPKSPCRVDEVRVPLTDPRQSDILQHGVDPDPFEIAWSYRADSARRRIGRPLRD